MIRCPLCEHEQPSADSCSVCGTARRPSKPPEAPVVPMADLEATGWEPQGGAVAVEVVPGLEATRMESPPIPPVPDGLGIELDLGRADAVGEVPAGGLPELELSRIQDNAPKTVLPEGGITCRYCRRIGRQGSFCEGCGMKLPNATGGARAAEVEKARCLACGARSARGAPCTDCGVEVPGGEG